MKFVRVDKYHSIEVPSTWIEAERLCDEALNVYYDARGGNVRRQAMMARIAFGLFNKNEMIPDPTLALVHLMQKICQRKGAGLDKPL